jgi:hypothetical protein
LNILILNKIISHILQQVQKFKQDFIEQLEDTLDENACKRKDLLVNNIKEELNEIFDIISIEANQTILSQVSKALNEKISLFHIETFINMTGLIKKILSGTKNLNDLIDKLERNFITSFYENKEKKIFESLDCENWKYEAQEIPENYQIMVKFIQNNNFKKIKLEMDRPGIAKLFDEDVIYNGEDKSNNLLDFGGRKYKLYMLTTLELIKLAYETIKIYLYFNDELGYLAIKGFLKLIIEFININNNIVLGGGGNKLKNYTQKGVAIVCSNANIAKNLLLPFTNFDSDNQNIYSDTIQVVEKTLSSAKSEFQVIFSGR